MANGADVLRMLIPTGGWVISGDNYEDIQFIEATPITKKEFEDAFKKFDEIQAKKDLEIAATKAAILDRIGLTADEVKLLLG
jgi:hypothetical protein